MKYLLILLISSDVFAGGYHYTRPYVRQDGTFVNGHMQGNPDNNPYNNWNYVAPKPTTYQVPDYTKTTTYGSWGSNDEK